MKLIVTSTILALLGLVSTKPVDLEPRSPIPHPAKLLVFLAYDKAPTECLTYHEGDKGWIDFSVTGQFDVTDQPAGTEIVGYHLSRPLGAGDSLQWSTSGQTSIRNWRDPNGPPLLKDADKDHPLCNNMTAPPSGKDIIPIKDGATCGSMGWPMKCVKWADNSQDGGVTRGPDEKRSPFPYLTHHKTALQRLLQ